jgi:hypothetical protein
METIQRMALDGSPLAVLAQQGAEATNPIIAHKSTDVPRRELSVGNNDQERRARSEAASSTSPNCRLSEHDARRCITQNRIAREYDRERDDLRNVTEDRRHLRLRTSSPTAMVFSRGRRSNGKEWISCSDMTTQTCPVARQIQD